MGHGQCEVSAFAIALSCQTPRRALTWVAAALLLICSSSQIAVARGRFIPASARIDMVYDDVRGVLYITSAGTVLRYSTSSDSFVSPFVLGGELKGIDLSPDGNTLAIADGAIPRIHLVDLTTEESTAVNFTPALGEAGTFSVAFGSDGAVLVSSSQNGSGSVPLRRYDPVAQTTTQLATISQDSMLCASADGSVIGFEESSSSSGPFGRYRVADSDLLRKTGYDDGTGWSNYEIGVNRNGTQYALPTYGGCYICDASLVKYDKVGVYAGAQPIGVVYHPLQDIVYFAWATTAKVRAYSTGSFAAPTAEYDFENTFDQPGNHAFVEGRMKISRDGNLLFTTVAGGVRYIRLNNHAPTANAQSVSTTEDTAVSITLTDSDQDADALTYVLLSNPAHGTLTGTAPNLVYLPAASYSGPDSFTFKVSDGDLESAPATVSITVTAPDNLPPTCAITSTPERPRVGGQISFDSYCLDPDGTVATAVWTFGDGTTGSGCTITHTYTSHGSHPVTCTVTDDDGKSASCAATVKISQSVSLPTRGWYLIASPHAGDHLLSQVQVTLLGTGETLPYCTAVMRGWLDSVLYSWDHNLLNYGTCSCDGPPIDDDDTLREANGYWLCSQTDGLALTFP